MENDVLEILYACLRHYSKDDRKQSFHIAQNIYTTLTGIINEDDDEYNHRINSFHDWFLFHYEDPEKKRIVIKDFMMRNSFPYDLEKSILDFEYSLFEYLGKSKMGEKFLNVIGEKEFIVGPESSKGTFVKGDLFISHLLTIQSNKFFTPGLCIIPRELKSTIVSVAKKRSLEDKLALREQFLLDLERLKSKSKSYQHLPPEKVFVFN